MRNLRLAFRTLRRTPAGTVISVLTLALGIGVTTAIFSVVKAVLLNPLAYGRPDRLVTIAEISSGRPDNRYVDAPTVQDWQMRSHSFENIALYADDSWVFLESGRAEVVRGLRVSHNFFDALGVKMQLGRTFLPEEDQPDRRSTVLILSYGTWIHRFGADPEILGRVLDLSDGHGTVIGVLSAEFPTFLHGTTELLPEMYMPAGYDFSSGCRRCQEFLAIGRLRPGVQISQAQVELNTIMGTLAREYSADYENGIGVRVTAIEDYVLGRVRTPLWVVFAAAGFLLVIACVNVASLLLTKGTARAREMAVRTALGARRRNIVDQLLTEILVLSLAGATGGFLIAFWNTRLLMSYLPAQIPRLHETRTDGITLLFTLGICLFTTLICGLVPAWFVTRVDLNELLKASWKGANGCRPHRLHDFFVIAELALAFVLTVGSGLMIKSFLRLMKVDPGYDPHNVLTLTTHIWGQPYWNDPGRAAEYYRQALARLRATPGVEGAAWTSILPLDYSVRERLHIEGRPTDTEAQAALVDTYSVSKDYFLVMRIPLKRGRTFEDGDNATSPKVAVISESCARTMFRGEDPIGKHVRLGEGSAATSWATVIGIVGDVRQYGLDRPSSMEVYASQEQDLVIDYYRLVARTRSDPHIMEQTVRSAFLTVDRTLPVYHIKSLEDYLAGTLASRRVALMLLGLFGVLALILGALGVYGTISYAVALRTREVGVRMALGAQRRDVLLSVLNQGFVLAATGLALGYVFSSALNRFLTSLLFEVGPMDAETSIVVAIVLMLVALLASCMPARRAATVDPIVVLHDE